MGFIAPFLPLIGTAVGIGGQVGMQVHGRNVTVGQAKELATSIVNSHEQMMKANIDAVRSGARTATQGLVEYDRLWESMAGKLHELGSVGERAIAERSPSGIWPYQTWYRGPIADMAGSMAFAPPPPPATGGAPGGPVYDVGARYKVTHEEPGPLRPVTPKPDYSYLWLALAVIGGAVILVKMR